MTLKKDRHLTMAELAAQQLHEAIVSGEMPAGSHLRLVDLAKELGMSPMPVREAIRRLESLGLVEVAPHRGAFVRELTAADLEDTMQMRFMLERVAVEKAAANYTEDVADTADSWLRRYLDLAEAGLLVEAREAHTELHFTLYRASGSRWLTRAIEPVWRNSERYRFTTTPHQGGTDLRPEHGAILEACREGDVQAAGEALVDHLSAAAERMKSKLKSSTKDPSDES